MGRIVRVDARGERSPLRRLLGGPRAARPRVGQRRPQIEERRSRRRSPDAAFALADAASLSSARKAMEGDAETSLRARLRRTSSGMSRRTALGWNASLRRHRRFAKAVLSAVSPCMTTATVLPSGSVTAASMGMARYLTLNRRTRELPLAVGDCRSRSRKKEARAPADQATGPMYLQRRRVFESGRSPPLLLRPQCVSQMLRPSRSVISWSNELRPSACIVAAVGYGCVGQSGGLGPGGGPRSR